MKGSPDVEPDEVLNKSEDAKESPKLFPESEPHIDKVSSLLMNSGDDERVDVEEEGCIRTRIRPFSERDESKEMSRALRPSKSPESANSNFWGFELVERLAVTLPLSSTSRSIIGPALELRDQSYSFGMKELKPNDDDEAGGIEDSENGREKDVGSDECARIESSVGNAQRSTYLAALYPGT
jgi:hypothetical protein